MICPCSKWQSQIQMQSLCFQRCCCSFSAIPLFLWPSLSDRVHGQVCRGWPLSRGTQCSESGTALFAQCGGTCSWQYYCWRNAACVHSLKWQQKWLAQFPEVPSQTAIKMSYMPMSDWVISDKPKSEWCMRQNRGPKSAQHQGWFPWGADA